MALSSIETVYRSKKQVLETTGSTTETAYNWPTLASIYYLTALVATLHSTFAHSQGAVQLIHSENHKTMSSCVYAGLHLLR